MNNFCLDAKHPFQYFRSVKLAHYCTCFFDADVQFCLPSFVNEMPRYRYLNFCYCFSRTPLTWREHCFACLDRHMVSIFVVLIFISATEHASGNLSRACWRPFWAKSSCTRLSANSRRCTLQSPFFSHKTHFSILLYPLATQSVIASSKQSAQWHRSEHIYI